MQLPKAEHAAMTSVSSAIMCSNKRARIQAAGSPSQFERCRAHPLMQAHSGWTCLLERDCLMFSPEVSSIQIVPTWDSYLEPRGYKLEHRACKLAMKLRLRCPNSGSIARNGKSEADPFFGVVYYMGVGPNCCSRSDGSL